MKYNLFLLLMVTLFGCSKRTANCEIIISDYAVYRGYGVVNFSYSRTGGIRYIEFYPICTNNIKYIERENITNSSFGEGIIIRENSSSKIWNTLIKDKSIIKNDDEFGKALIYIEFKTKIEDNKPPKKFKNYISLFNKNFNLIIVDIGLYNIDTQKIKVIKGIK